MLGSFGLLCFALLRFALLCYDLPGFALLFLAMRCFAMLCHALLRFAFLLIAMLCHTLLCYALLSFAGCIAAPRIRLQVPWPWPWPGRGLGRPCWGWGGHPHCVCVFRSHFGSSFSQPGSIAKFFRAGSSSVTKAQRLIKCLAPDMGYQRIVKTMSARKMHTSLPTARQLIARKWQHTLLDICDADKLGWQQAPYYRWFLASTT